MPDTWQEFMPSAQCSGDHAPPACGNMCIYNPDANIHVGTAYLRYLIDRYDGDIIAALASYNAGMSAVDDAQADLDSIQMTFRHTPPRLKDMWETSFKHGRVSEAGWQNGGCAQWNGLHGHAMLHLGSQ